MKKYKRIRLGEILETESRADEICPYFRNCDYNKSNMCLTSNPSCKIYNLYLRYGEDLDTSHHILYTIKSFKKFA